MKIEAIKTPQGNVKVPVSIDKEKRVKAPDKIIKIYDKLRREKKYAKLADTHEKRKKKKNIKIIEEMKDLASTKSSCMAAKKVSDKYKKNALLQKTPT